MQRVNIGLVCLSWLVLASAVSAQTAVDPISDAGIAEVQNYSGSGLLRGTYFDVRHVTGDGVGYYNSYSQIGAFTPFWMNEDAFVAPNARMIITNSTQIGVNAGLVGRRYVESLDRIFGVYGYYDNDQDNYNNRYSQYTVGAETLGQWWDLRGNGYFVNGSQDNMVTCLGVGGSPFYVGNQIAFLGQQLNNQALGGGDVEFGIPVAPNAQWLRAYSGVYAYRSSQQETFGYRGRVEAMLSNDLTVGVIVSQDRLWGTNVNATIDFKFAGFLPTRYFPNMTTRQRMLNPVQRNWRVATHTYVENVNIAAIDPDTNKPYFITHVDNSKSSVGANGTYEHPYTALPGTAPGQIVLVHLGNSSVANPVGGSITLSDNQRLLGDGKLSQVHLFAQYCNTIDGIFTLPGTSNSGLYPTLTNSNAGLNQGSIVTLANNNEVAGLSLLNSAGDAIRNTSAGSNNFLLQCLNISGNHGMGINLVNASGSGMIKGINGVNGAYSGSTNFANPNGFGANAGGGISIGSGPNIVDASNPGLNLTMMNVTMNANNASPQLFGVKLFANDAPLPNAASNAPLTVTMTNVSANGNGTGIQLSETNQSLTAYLNGVTANSNTGNGIQASGSGGSITLTDRDPLTGNPYSGIVTATGNGGDNLQIGSQLVPISSSTVNAQFDNAIFTNSTGGSGIVFSQSGGTGTLNLASVTATGNNVDGLKIVGVTGTTMTTNITKGLFQNNTEDAFHVETANANTKVNLFVEKGQASSTTPTTNASHSGRDGLYINSISGSFANVEIDNTTLANSGQNLAGSSAMHVGADGVGTKVTLLTNYTLGNDLVGTPNPGTQDFGISLDLRNSSTFTGNINNGNFSNVLTNAVKANVVTGATGTLNLLSTASNFSGAEGIKATVDGAGSSLITDFKLSTVNNSVKDGMNFSVTNGGTLASTFEQNSGLNSSGLNGIFGHVDGVGSTATVNLINGVVNGTTYSGTTINKSGEDGINFSVANSGILNVNATGSSIAQNGFGVGNGSGVVGTVDTSGTANLVFTNTIIGANVSAGLTGNRDNGVFVTTTTLGNVNGTFDGGSVNGNGLTAITARNNDGILFDMNHALNSSLTVKNGATVNGNGNDGIATIASNGTIFTESLGGATAATGISIKDNGAALSGTVPTGAGVNVTTQSSSVVTLNLNNVTSGNTATVYSGKQQYGLLFNTNSLGVLNGTVTSSTLTNNIKEAINGTVTGTGTETGSVTRTQANLTLNNVTGDGSGNYGAFFNVTGGGQLIALSPLSSSFSNSGNTGMLVNVDGTGNAVGTTSAAYLDLASIQLNNNGKTFPASGFYGNALGGGSLNVCFDTDTTSANTTSLSNNSTQGLSINAQNAGSIANVNVDTATINNNVRQGALIMATDHAIVNYRSANSTYTTNGANGIFDGVQVVSGSDTGPVAGDGATVRVLFTGDTATGNTGNGYSLNVKNGSTLTASMSGVTASQNGGYGIFTSSTDPNNLKTNNFNLLMSGSNTFSTNGLGGINSLNFNGLNQVVLDIAGTFNNNTGDGVSVNLQNITNAAVAIEGPGTIDGNTGNGINVSMTKITNGALTIDGFSSISNNTLDGILVNFDTVTNGAIEIEGLTANTTTTTMTGNKSNGIEVKLQNTKLVNNLDTSAFGTTALTVLTTTSNTTTPLNCLPLPVATTLNSVINVPTKGLTIDSMTVSGSTKDGIVITETASAIANPNGIFITNNVVTSNGLDGLRFNLNGSNLLGLNVANNTFSSNGTTGAGNGIEFTSATGAVVNSSITNAVFDTNIVDSNKGDGFRMVNPDTFGTPINLSFIKNDFSSNTGTGVNLSLATSAQNLTASFDKNTINQNKAQGVNLTMGANATVASDFTNNVINGNTSDGINITLGTGGTFTGNNFYGNTIGGGAGLGNGGMGVRLTVPDKASFNWNLGDTTQAANLISNNVNAGVGIAMSGASTGAQQTSGILNVANTVFSNTTNNNADVNFTGDGLKVLQQGSTKLTGSILKSTFQNNANNGAFFQVSGTNSTLNSSINNFQIGDGTAANANTFSNNSVDGLSFLRTANGSVNGLVLNKNTLNSNGANGLHIVAASQIGPDTYTINNNDISNNINNGVLFAQRADANIVANMDLNTITKNQANGIQLIEQTSNPNVDQRALGGTWTRNTITNNSRTGIELNGITNGLLIGDTSDITKGNTISSNTLNGIEDTSGGSLTIGSNIIQLNGTAANIGTANENAGILLSVLSSNISVVNNVIGGFDALGNPAGNHGDGIQYQIRSDNTSATITIDGNAIVGNDGRGINLLNRSNDNTTAVITNNFVNNNKLEGVYIVNTASFNQTIWASSSDALLADGSVFSTPHIGLTFTGNQVNYNGLGSTFPGTGLVIRVGTSGQSEGFASSFNGGVNATVTGNNFTGNNGDDILFHSFVSTVAPITTTGTWDNTQFVITAQQNDPLSRFDLTYNNNLIDPNSIDTVGTSLGGFLTRNPALVAFYNDSDGVFKSRLNTITAPNIAGPYNNATRARNATRLADRLPFFDAPTNATNFPPPGTPNTLPGASYLYPGMGQSTWRVHTSTVGIFTLDTSPFVNTFDANGNFLNGIGNNGEQPYGYGTF